MKRLGVLKKQLDIGRRKQKVESREGFEPPTYRSQQDQTSKSVMLTTTSSGQGEFGTIFAKYIADKTWSLESEQNLYHIMASVI